MSNHIEKMAMAIYLKSCDEDGDDIAKAQAAFDALMDAVPDLVWGEKSSISPEPNTTDRGGWYICAHRNGRSYRYNYSKNTYSTSELYCNGCHISNCYDENEAINVANTHNREQVRAMWPEVGVDERTNT